MKRVLTITIAFLILLSLQGIAMDNAPPFVEFSWSPQYPSVGQNVTFNASSSYDSDGYIVNYTWDFGDGGKAYGKIVRHAYTMEGIYNVTLVIVDDGGQKASLTKNINVDGTPPFTSCQPFPEKPNGKNGWYISPVKIELIAHDNLSGVYQTKYKIDYGEWKIYDGTIKINEGIHMLRFYSIDNSGNRESIKRVLFRVDYTSPSTYIGENITSRWKNEDVNITLTSLDYLSGVENIYYILDNVFHTYEEKVEIGEGNHTFYYYSSDKAGNVEQPHKLVVKVDKHSPSIKIVSPSHGIYLFGRKIASSDLTIVFGEVEVKAMASDNLSGIAYVNFYIDGNLVYRDDTPPYSWKWEESTIGIKEIKVTAYDVAGNYEDATRNIIIFKI